jgi:UDP-N-acetylglucosamine transferase subunit ALG13
VTDAPKLPTGDFVFVSVGTDHHPFDRLIDLCEAWAKRTGIVCFIQSGTSRTPQTVAGSPYLPYPTMAAAMASAVAVVSHGGPATIMLARQCGRVPIVTPRDPERGEHVDGHQQEFSRWMAAKGQVFLAETGQELEAHLDAAIADPSAYRVASDDDTTAAAVGQFADLVNDLMQKKRPR